MKRYLLVLTSVLVLFVLGVSVVRASISIPVSTSISVPPADPTVEPPGLSISHEQVLKAQRCQEWYDNYIRTQCFTVPGGAGYTIDPECRRRAVRALNECLEAVLNPPTLILPNGGSPGQGN